MSSPELRLVPLIWKTAVVHTVTYFLFGLLSLVFFDYEAKFADPMYAGIIRPMDHPLIMAGPLFQPVRGLIFALVFFPLRRVLFQPPLGWLILWWILLALGILNPFGAAPGSIEGMLYSPLPFLEHLIGLPETVFQSLALAGLLFYWVHHPDNKWLSWCLHLAMIIIYLLLAMGLFFGSS